MIKFKDFAMISPYKHDDELAISIYIYSLYHACTGKLDSETWA